LREKYGEIRELEEMPPGRITDPSVVFKPPETKKKILLWDAEKVLKLWKGRGPYASEGAPDLFERVEDVTQVSASRIGRDRLVLKARSVEELMYYTTDDD
jgi:hypothetical protein